MNSRKITLVHFLLVSAFCFVAVFAVALPVFAQEVAPGDNSAILGGIAEMSAIGPVVFGKMLHSWVSLIAAVILFILALTYMKGGYLARPLLLVGFGAFVEALSGLFLPPSLYLSWMWVGDLTFSLSVIIAVFWMERLFRASQA